MRILISGVSGFAGSHLVDLLAQKKNIEIHGLRRSAPEGASAPVLSGVYLHECDLRNAGLVQKLMLKIKPDRIFHLAAQSSVRVSLDFPEATFIDNVFGTLNILEAAKQLSSHPSVLVSGSAEEYGASAVDQRSLKESASLKPLNPYAVSKITQSFLAYQYFLTSKLKIVRTRAFNHTGPRQSDAFVVSNFAKQVAMIEAGQQKPVIEVGNLKAVRDFTDVRDVARAYSLALEKGRPGEVYNVCSGRGKMIGDILDLYLGEASVKIKVKPDKKRQRAADIPRLVGDPKKFMKHSGWKPEIPLERTLKDVLNYWRSRVNSAKGKLQ